MTTISFETVWQGILGLLEKPAGTTLSATYEGALLSWFNARVRRGYQYGPWPELLLTEERAFRPIWNSAVAYNGGDERYLATTDTYYVAVQAGTNKNPATETTYWREMTSTELELYVPWNPPDLTPLGTVLWVGWNDRIRYSEQPYTLTHGISRRGVEVSGSGIGTKVWIQHRVRAPRFSRTTLGAGVEATLGQYFLQAADGECYQAVYMDGVKTLIKQEFPEFLQGYVAQGCLADDLRRDGQAERAESAEEEAGRLLEEEWDVQTGQQGQ